MTNSQRLATVRSHLRWWLAQTTEEDSSDQILSESILIIDGFYAGRTFETASHRATWFMEPDELKIHDQQRSVAAVFRGDEITADHPILLKEPEIQASEVVTASVVEEKTAEIPDLASEMESEQDDQPVSLPISAGKKTSTPTAPAAENENEQDGDVRLPKAA